MSDCCTTETIEIKVEPRVPGKIRTVALIGPPNSGKSTLFNRLTGLRQKVANYPGVTVEQHFRQTQRHRPQRTHPHRSARHLQP